MAYTSICNFTDHKQTGHPFFLTPNTVYYLRKMRNRADKICRQDATSRRTNNPCMHIPSQNQHNMPESLGPYSLEAGPGFLCWPSRKCNTLRRPLISIPNCLKLKSILSKIKVSPKSITISRRSSRFRLLFGTQQPDYIRCGPYIIAIPQKTKRLKLYSSAIKLDFPSPVSLRLYNYIVNYKRYGTN